MADEGQEFSLDVEQNSGSGSYDTGASTAKKERRIPRTSQQVMDKMQRIADEHHDGALRENVIEIFDQLHPIDRQTFLRKCLILFWEEDINHVSESLKDVKVDKETSIDMSVLKSERKDLRQIDAEEQIKLKTWMNKAFFVIGAMSFAVIAAVTLITGELGGKKVNTLIDNLSTIIDLVKG